MKTAFVSPFASAISDVFAVSVSPTWAVPSMVGPPVAVLLGLPATAGVAALVNVSWLPLSSVKETRTLIALPSSESVRVYVELVAPAISVSLFESHW